MNTERKREFIIDVAFYSIIMILVFVFFKYFLKTLFPFVLGFIIAFSLKPLIRRIVKKTKINNKIASLVILLLFYALIGFAMFLIVVQVVSILSNLFEQFPIIFANEIQPLINSFTNWLGEVVYRIDPEVVIFIEQLETSFLDSLKSFVTSFSAGSITFLTSIITRIPGFFLAFFFSVISSFFITLDYEKITLFLSAQFSGRANKLFTGIQKNGVSVIVNFIKAYGILLSITFIESIIGLKLIGVNNAVGISIIIAIVDILPILGTGTVIVPWAIIEMFNGNLGVSIGLILMYIVITVIRQILEPRVVGEQIGLYPLITLICMYVGTTYFGVIGLFLVPIIVTILVKLQDDGIITFYKSVSTEANEEVNVEEEVSEWKILM